MQILIQQLVNSLSVASVTILILLLYIPAFKSLIGAEHVMPTHSPPGDGSLVAKEKAFIVDLRTRALALKQQGVDAEKAGGLLTAEFKTKYPDWPSMNVTNFVKSIYAE